MRIYVGNSKRNGQRGFLGKLPLRLAGLVVLAVVFVLGSALAEGIYRERRIAREMDELKAQIGAMEKDNYQLAQLIDYYQTQEFKEAEARRRLNLKADGERVVMIDEAAQAYELAQKVAAPAPQTPNAQKWWNYFFTAR